MGLATLPAGSGRDHVGVGNHQQQWQDAGKIVSEELEPPAFWLWAYGRAWRAEQTLVLAGDTWVLPV